MRTGGPNCFIATTSMINSGYTLGAGIEIALTNDITVKSEYSYLNLEDSAATKVLAQSLIGGGGVSPGLIHCYAQ